jgi:hypothetical protein
MSASVVGYLAAAILIPLLTPFISKLLKKLGTKQITETDFKSISNQKYPGYYQYFYLIMAIILVGIPIGFMFLCFIYGPRIQQALFGQNAVIFVSGTGLYLISIVGFIDSILVFGPLLSALFLILSTPNFKKYLLYKQGSAGYKTTLSSGLTSIEKFGIILFIILIPFGYLGIHDYQAVYPDKVIINSYFNFTDKVYSFNQIQKVSVSSSIASSTDKEGSVSYYTKLSIPFDLNDGTQVDIGNNIIDFVRSDFYSTLRNNKVTINIVPPSKDVINREFSCNDVGAKIDFSNLFQINNPKFTEITCN